MKIAIIGIGLRTAHIALDFKNAAPNAEFVAFYDPDAHATIIEKMRGDATLPKTRYDDLEEMFNREKIDFLIIASPNHLHLQHIRAALNTTIAHIFIEKPIVTTIADSLELARLMAQHDGENRLTVGLVLRYSPLYRALLAAQNDGHIGDVMSIEASEHIAPYHGSFFMRDWRRLSAFSGGFMLEKCCHDLDLYQNFIGSRPAQIASFGGRKKYIPQSAPANPPAYLDVKKPIWNAANDAFGGGGDIIDYQTALVEYTNGANLAFHTNLNVPDEFRRFCVIGTDGMAEGDFIRNYFRVTLSETSERVIDKQKLSDGTHKGHYGADAQMARDVVAFINGEETGEKVSPVPALEAGITALAMDQARNEKRVVELSDIWSEFDDALNTHARGVA